MKILLQKKKISNEWNSQFESFSKALTYNQILTEEKDFIFWSYYLAIGNFDFVEKSKNIGANVFENSEWFKYSYYARFFGDELLNRDYCILPAVELKRLKYEILGRYSEDCKIFVRPDAGNKVFTGTILDIEEFDSFSEEYNENLVVISKPNFDITGEWRFAASCEGEILGVSLYRYSNNLVSAASCPPKMMDYVTSLLKDFKEYPNKILTIDIASINDKRYKVIECNAFSTSGLYAMKPEKIVEYIKLL
jgi:hypothetical protein